MRQIPYNASYLASTHVNTPDPRRDPAPVGQRLLLEWVVPPEILAQDPQIVLTVIYKNHTQAEKSFPLTTRSGHYLYDVINEKFKETKGVLTYRGKIVLAGGEVYKEWKHQLWVNLITLDEEKKVDALRTSSSDSSQSIQESVTEMPYESEDNPSDPSD